MCNCKFCNIDPHICELKFSPTCTLLVRFSSSHVSFNYVRSILEHVFSFLTYEPVSDNRIPETVFLTYDFCAVRSIYMVESFRDTFQNMKYECLPPKVTFVNLFSNNMNEYDNINSTPPTIYLCTYIS